ncbi:hypothetical protein [Brazilian marseillevirus]|uniref:hypothetical protein n=1 Tax=Brazilian marseillevirus TaxID=1813599 RepID=UPI0007867A6A|nr:hypothetical protein A3303_gp177 [Brazilian marseillevirus]AMQ10685.1 hypothetical protein [Brazilian marseillevirus]
MEFLGKRDAVFFCIVHGFDIPADKFTRKGKHCPTLPDGSFHGKYSLDGETASFRLGKAHGEYIYNNKLSGSFLSGNYIDGEREGEFTLNGKNGLYLTFMYEDDKLVFLSNGDKEMKLDWDDEKMCCTLSKGGAEWVRTYSFVPNDVEKAFLRDYVGWAGFQEPPCFSKITRKLDTHKKGEIYWEFEL